MVEHCAGVLTQISNYHSTAICFLEKYEYGKFCVLYALKHARIPRGEGGKGFGPPPPKKKKNHTAKRFFSNTGPDPHEITKLTIQHSTMADF